MRIKILRGVSGYWQGIPYQYPVGSVQVVDDFIGHDLIKCGHAMVDNMDHPPRPKAIAPMIERDISIKAIVKRGRKPKDV